MSSVNNQSTIRKRKHHWQQVIERNPKAYVVQCSKPDSAKQDLKRFVEINRLQYRKRTDCLTEFEDLFGKLNLNDDDDLLDRADRRDLPTSIQLISKGNRNDRRSNIPAEKVSRRSSSCKLVPRRRSAIPNTIVDDFAYRRYNQGSGARLLNDTTKGERVASANVQHKHLYSNVGNSISYMSLATYDHCFDTSQIETDSRNQCCICNDSIIHRMGEKCLIHGRYPDLITDDLLNRRIRQSSSAKVPPPQPPFGIPNSPITSFIHTYPQFDYSRVEPDRDQFQKRQSSRRRDREPHLINDDLAFRSLRKDYRLGNKLDYDDVQILSRTVSASDLPIEHMRQTLRPTKLPSLTSTISDSLSTTTTSPISDSSSHSFLSPSFVYATSNSVINETPEPSQHEFFSSKSKTSLLEVTNSMQVVPNFINEDEEQLMMNEIEKVLKRIRYEQSHWDDAIHNYRETEHLRWRAENKLIIDRVREKAFSSNAKHIKYVHILDIAKDGHIKPHVDSVRFCGDTISGISLLSNSVMRLALENDPSQYVDILLERRSLYIMRGDARYKYTHAILEDKDSYFCGKHITRDRRISVICRNEPSSETS